VSVAPGARELALDPPRAYPLERLAATVRAQPEDFVVEEDLGFSPSGHGQHLLVKVQKRNANTQWVARELARAAGCRAADVGYAGLKDRRAVALQWFSVPRGAAEGTIRALSAEEFTVLEAHAHSRKLPRGALAGNRFAIRLRPAGADAAAAATTLAPSLALIAARGVPNYFGPQRFGRDGANLAPGPLPPPGTPARGFRLSAARSLLFNALLAERVADGSWEQLRAGDLAALEGRGSYFAVEALDEVLGARCARLEIHPTGPLWGTGAPESLGAVQALEVQVAARHAAERALCEAAGMRQERRSLRLAVHELTCVTEDDALLLRFRLTRGGFATAVLRELLQGAPGELQEP
jgi:tRNA pseudouridine13 synthase